MDKGVTVPKWVLIVLPKIPPKPQTLSAQTQKFWISMKKGFIGRPLSMIALLPNYQTNCRILIKV